MKKKPKYNWNQIALAVISLIILLMTARLNFIERELNRTEIRLERIERRLSGGVL